MTDAVQVQIAAALVASINGASFDTPFECQRVYQTQPLTRETLTKPFVAVLLISDRPVQLSRAGALQHDYRFVIGINIPLSNPALTNPDIDKAARLAEQLADLLPTLRPVLATWIAPSADDPAFNQEALAKFQFVRTINCLFRLIRT